MSPASKAPELRTLAYLPENPSDLLAPFPGFATVSRGLISLLGHAGLWQHPMRAYGDLERMRLIDKLYWLYKATRPIERARRDSGLEQFFEEQKQFRWALPPGFEVTSVLTVSAGGDLMNHDFLAGSSDSLYAEVSDLVLGADLSMANLECPVIRSAGKDLTFGLGTSPSLSYDVASFSVAKGTGGRKFTFLATACNHSLDFGVEGVESTIDFLRGEGIAFNGLNPSDDDARRATLIDRNGIKIGIVAYTFGLNGRKPPAARPNIVSRMLLNDGAGANDFGQLRAQLDWCKSAGIDFVIAHLHWGYEFEYFPSPEQQELAHHVAELGVDLVVGHHPHVLQPAEFYRTRRDPLRVVPIFYSLGNLINPFSAPYLCRGGIARLDLAKGRLADGTKRVYVRDAVLVEIVQQVDAEARRVRLVPA